jgi:hypothetical protein
MSSDLVSILGDFAQFIRDERNAAYREAEKQELKYIKDWIRRWGVEPSPSDSPTEALDDFMKQLRLMGRMT